MTTTERNGTFFTTGCHNRRLVLIIYDLLILLAAAAALLLVVRSYVNPITPVSFLLQYLLLGASITGTRLLFRVYSQIWRYSNASSYIRMILADGVAFCVYLPLSVLCSLLPWWLHVAYVRVLAVELVSLVGCITIRFFYTWVYEHSATMGLLAQKNALMRGLVGFIGAMTGFDLTHEDPESVLAVSKRIKVAILGAGRVGVSLAEELQKNPKAVYNPVCFIDIDQEKSGRTIGGIPVLSPDDNIKYALDLYQVQEVIFAIQKEAEHQHRLYEKYTALGYKVKAYTLPVGNSTASGKMQIREFQAEELLFRQPVDYLDERTTAYYRGKVVLVTGGGGSIGSELARQIARMAPRQLIILDIYENNAYDIQQELHLLYGDKLNLAVEIASVRDAAQLEKVFACYKPQVVLHAAAHKHVPLMEHNCSEAVKNNVFGTWNLVNAAEKHGVEKFVMISTDKAVNPTNVMGATKRLCEMIVLSRVNSSKTAFSCTRFGNVLGSNGSVIPLFKRQIANGGPVTLTDKRIIRYFMTIPEASQLVLTSGAMARSGELFVLDMGRPVRIYDLAVNMIRLSGLEPDTDIKIVETGLRPGEKLYEDLLVKTEAMHKTDNDMIFIEQDRPLSAEEIDAKLNLLREALATQDDEVIRSAMKKVVPTYRDPRDVNEGFKE